MKSIAEKLEVLSRIAHTLNNGGVTWAVGGSLLLYLNGVVDDFNDIDLGVLESDIDRFIELISPMGESLPAKSDERFRTRHYLKFVIAGVQIDALAGFVIVHEGVEYDRALTPDKIAGHACVNGENIPLQALADWREYYYLMGRHARVEQIDEVRK